LSRYSHHSGGHFYHSHFPYAAISAARQQNVPLSILTSSRIKDKPPLLLASIVTPFGETPDGELVKANSIPWFDLASEISHNPDFMDELDWRKLEQLVAGAYDRAGFDVTLTPRSGDHGRDVIATKDGFGSIKIIDQVKKLAPGRRVPANDVRAVMGVLDNERDASKAVLTTTSTFAPGVYEEFEKAIPYRLELKDRPELLKWLESLLKE